MIKFYRISEIIYLLFGGLFLFRAFYYYGAEDARTAVDIAISAVAFLMFYIRRRYRKKLEARKQS
ncbi:MAG: hypothetical protein GWO82_01635 [Bacteroidetes bacterium]|nr:hypothetical protein [Bacteroidota bacterium]